MSDVTTQTSQLRDYYDRTDQSAAVVEAVSDSTVGEVLVSTSIRLPKSLMDAVRDRAAALGVPATTLMRQWIAAQVEEPAQDEQVVSVADLRQLIATRAHRTAS
jgi:predicted DNA binding CopG/RHH family protein